MGTGERIGHRDRVWSMGREMLRHGDIGWGTGLEGGQNM